METMEMLDWGLTAAAALLFLFALRVMFTSGKDDETPKLGCGFGVLAAGLWIYVLRQHIDDFWTPIRLGVGALLVLPAAQALARPKGGTLMRGVVGIVLASVIAGPVVQELWSQHGPDDRPTSVRRLDEHLAEMRSMRDGLRDRQAKLVTMRAEAKAEVQVHGSTWEEIKGNEAALAKLNVLREIEKDIEQTEQNIALLDAKIPDLEAQLSAASEATAEAELDPELEALRREVENAPGLDELSTVEQYERKLELEELFEREF